MWYGCVYRVRNRKSSQTLPRSRSKPDWTQGLPRNGGEKNYLEYLYRQPKLLATCMYAVYAVFIVKLYHFIASCCSAPHSIYYSGMASSGVLSVWGM